ncbi:hypothetical protein QLL95_gp0344 [Cotonvirus japonicus]|uniref:C2H2-type domain-containing protein n=1 Tax=Cotonvirus japonicus TaxID=2811091 RepID=A0ABM7NUG6_9VIRU|nr:hypothetical protein QLL95_gp0344 [Cotonvirus japonicus]BCS83779.1 hypothetical protein [Cotonvirus japonicus]
MSKFKCKKCNYQTNNKNHFNDHLNRKIPCSKYNSNKKIKEIKNVYCETCNRTFAREDSLSRHNKTYHSEITGDNNNQNNNQNNGNNNTITNITTQNNIQTQININNPIIIQPIIYSYDYNDINDLTLFEQYLSLTSKTSPYTALLDHLNLNPTKPKYHNIKLTNLNRSVMDVHNGERWIKEIMNDALSNIVDSKRIMIYIIFNRFRCFLSKKATKLIPKSYYYGCGSPDNFYFHKKIVNNVKVHLYNYGKINKKIDENIPENRDNEVFWALSKKFKWGEVEKIIIKMDEFGIDLDNDLDVIKKLIKEKLSGSEITKSLKKFIKRVNKLITDFKNEEESSSGESSSESDNFLLNEDNSDDY